MGIFNSNGKGRQKMPPLSLPRIACETKRRNACDARPASGSQKELTSIFSKPSCGRSSKPSDVRPNAGCSPHNCGHSARRFASPGRNILGRGRDRPGGHRGLHPDPDKLGSYCCTRDFGRDHDPGPCRDLDRDPGRGKQHPVEPPVLMPKPNRRLSMPLQLISFVNDSYNLLRFSPGPTSFTLVQVLAFSSCLFKPRFATIVLKAL